MGRHAPASHLSATLLLDSVVLIDHAHSIDSHRGLLARLTQSCRCPVIAINYRLAPEHPFPAGLEVGCSPHSVPHGNCPLQDAIMAYMHLVNEGTLPKHISIMGDSAGGGLTMATVLALRYRRRLLLSVD